MLPEFFTTGMAYLPQLHDAALPLGLQAFMQAAGIRCSQRLGDLVTELPQADERELAALLEGGR